MTTKQKIYHPPLGKPVSANDRTYHVTMWVGEDGDNDCAMYVQVTDFKEFANWYGHYLADVVRALVRDNPQIETEREAVDVLQDIVDGFNEWMQEGISSLRRFAKLRHVRRRSLKRGSGVMSKLDAELRRRLKSGEPVERTRVWFLECIRTYTPTDLTPLEQEFIDEAALAWFEWMRSRVELH